MAERLFKLLGALLLLLSLIGGWYGYAYKSFAQRPLQVGEAGVQLELLPGESFSAMARELEQRSIIDDARYLKWMARLKGVSHRIQAGEYRITPGTTPPELLSMLVAGRVEQYTLTLVEGWSFREVMEAVRSHPKLRQTLDAADPQTVMAQLGYPGQHPEGRFFPDTYHFPGNLTDVEFLRRAYRAMERRLAQEWAERAEGLPYETPYEALVMASIVEKETGQPDERAAIAGVFVRRLQRGMRLQTDPTVIYGLGAGFDGNLRRRDLRGDTPYNTYRHHGLPPTPIAMPGGAALHAALHPAEGDALYFVSRGDGSHHFSATLEEHNRAVARYQLRGGRE